MEKRHVFLIGMPGSGKSSVGRLLAENLRLPFVDLDDEIERAAGKPITDIFRDDGEGTFRDLEHDVVATAVAGPPSVIACGGGVPLREDNRSLIKGSGKVVWLRSSSEKLWGRIRRGAIRPLIRGPVDLRRIEQEREHVYRDLADQLVAADDAPEVVARAIAEAIG